MESKHAFSSIVGDASFLGPTLPLKLSTGHSNFEEIIHLGASSSSDTDIGVNTTATGNQFNISFGMELTGQANETYKLRNSSMTFLDSPSTTSALTYKVQGRVDANGILYINRDGQSANADYGSRGISTLTVMEIAG